jgi:hypothetical protein
MRILLCPGITCGSTRKTVNLHVELVSDEGRLDGLLDSDGQADDSLDFDGTEHDVDDGSLDSKGINSTNSNLL